MSTSPPFAASPEIEQWLLSVPAGTDGKEPGFSCSPRYGVTQGNELIESFEGDHYSITYAAPEDWGSFCPAQQVDIAGRLFWIASDNLDKLRGKTLTALHADVGQGRHTDRVRRFVVAL